MLERIKKEVNESPGCYLYYKGDTVIYVGKAKNLKKRMMSYFNRANNLKTTKLVSQITDFQYIVTKTEREALILENNLIKKYNPKYNILLKDNKRYPFLVLTDEPHPQIIKTRSTKIKGTYFGPLAIGSNINIILEYLHREIPIRRCSVIPKEECIYYHLKQCYAPCIKQTDQAEIDNYKAQVKYYLGDNLKNIDKLLTKYMMQYAQNLEFERAQQLKEVLEKIKMSKETQAVEFVRNIDVDVYNFYKDENWISFSIVSVIEGKVMNVATGLCSYTDDYIDSIISFLYAHYLENPMPNLFICEDEELSKAIKSNLIITDHSSHLSEYKQLLVMAKMNANEYFKNNVDKQTKKIFEAKQTGYEQLVELVKTDLPLIEMYDISHTSGEHQVGVKIAYENGKKNNKLYRKYKIKEAAAADDYGSMREVLTRRLKRMIESGEDYPSMIIVDGGKGQVSVALEVLKAFYVDQEIMLIGLAKDDKHRTRAIVNKNLEEKAIPPNSMLYKFFFQMQEEVHRFAIDFHRSIQTKSMFASKLDNIKGIGSKRKRMLLDKFETIENIKNATEKDIMSLGISREISQEILKKLNEEEK